MLIGVRADGSKELAVGDGALGFWKALAEVFPETREQRCWVHKTANVLGAMPKSAQPGAKKAVQDIYNAEARDHAAQAIIPAEHWIHLRTTNPIESTFSTVRLRTKVTRGAGSRTAALAMVFNSSNPPSNGGGPWTHPTSPPRSRRSPLRTRRARRTIRQARLLACRRRHTDPS